jgi:phage repressor protein C with HTH and peptisase S24 domain
VNNGDLVMIDLTEKRFRNEGVYAFILGDMLLVKRIQPQPGGEFQARSDNPAYSPITLKPGADQVTVVGRVVYAMHRFT